MKRTITLKSIYLLNFLIILLLITNQSMYADDGPNSIEFVGLTSFSVEYVNGEILIQWETATEVNIYGYDIVRGNTNDSWSTIGFIPGGGTRYTLSKYSYIDLDPIKNDNNLYYLKQINSNGYYVNSDTITISITTDVNDDKLNSFELDQNYPNPFNPTTNISYSLQEASNVEMIVFNALGEKIAILENKFQYEGRHSVIFDASNFPSGVYFYRISAGDFVQTKKMMLIR